MQDHQQTFVKMGLDAWNGIVKRTDKVLSSISDEQLMKETSPGRNTGVYLLGHLVAVNDGMLKILGLGERQYADLDAIFLQSPDKSGKEMPDAATLRSYWTASCDRLSEHFSKMEPADWFGRHMSVSEEDFAKEPHRNKLNVVIGRSVHMSEHYGQLVFLADKKG